MAQSELKRIEISDFRHGLNTKDASHEIILTQVSDIQNTDLSDIGKAKTRGGMAKLNTTVIATAAGIFGAFYGKSLHFCAALTDVYKLVSGAYTSIKSSLTSNSQTYFEEWKNYVYFVNGAEVPQKFDGANVTVIGGAPSGWTTDKPEFIKKHENRLWTFTAATSQLHWSALDNPEDWTTVDDAGSHSFSPNDGYTGTGIESQKGGIVVFKQKGIYKVTGKTTVSFRFPILYDTIGCIAPRSIVNMENRIFFLAEYKGDYGVYVLDDGGGLTHLSHDITPTLNLINTSTANTAAAIAYKDKYILSYPLAAGGWGTVKLNYKAGSWEKDTGNPAQCYYTQGGNLYGGSASDGYVKQIETGTNDDGTLINSYVTTKNYLMEGPEFIKHLEYIAIWAKASGSWSMNINLYIDDVLVPKNWTMDLGTKGGVKTTRHEFIKLNEDIQGGMVKTRFGTSTKDQPFELYKAILYYRLGNPIVD